MVAGCEATGGTVRVDDVPTEAGEGLEGGDFRDAVGVADARGDVPRDAGFDAGSRLTDAGSADVRVADVPPEAAVDVGAAVDAGGSADVVAPMDAGDPGTDDAQIVATSFPSSLGCTARTTATVTVRNTGTTTWRSASGYALGAVDDSDPLYTTDTRVRLAADVAVAPGETRDFTIPLTAPGAAGSYTTDWRMVREGVRWFGAATTQHVDVACTTTTVGDFRLADVTIIGSPDVRGFAVTSHITSLRFSPGTMHVDHTRRGMWTPVVIDPDGTTQEATVWVFFHIGGQWYATGGERLRPSQTDKALDNPSQIGPGWLYDPGRWGVMTGYVPSPGDLVGFMVVSGSTRSDDHVVEHERTAVILVPFPADDVTTEFPPVAWEE